MRKKGIRFLTLLLGAAMILAVVGCSSGTIPNGDDTEVIDNGLSGDDTVETYDDTAADYILAEAEYPEMAVYPNEEDYYTADGGWDDQSWSADFAAWQESYNALKTASEGYDESLLYFFHASVEAILSDAGEENRIYSPINVWLALAMLAEITDGDSRQEILSLCGVDDMETLRQQAGDVWRMAYLDDGTVTSILGSSLWLSDQLDYYQETLDTLSEAYYASAYYGEMGSDAFNQVLRDWLNDQTQGLLSEQTQGIELDASTIMALATTIYFKAGWVDPFYEENTYQQTFHSPGGDTDCDFMHKTDTGYVYFGEGFMATGLSLYRGGTMWLILPDEDTDADTLLAGTDLTEFISAKSSWENKEYYQISLSVPKFDVSSSLELSDSLETLGIRSVFDDSISDFTPLTDTENVFVSNVEHAARVKIDEEGVEAAAYTVAMESGAEMIPEQLEFILDRPFLFSITDSNGLPLFIGVVNEV